MSVDAEGPAEAEKRDLRSSTTIQGNILAPFNKPYQRFLFLSFRNSDGNAKAWLAELLRADAIASTRAVVDHGRARKDQEEPETKSWLAVSFTSAALVTLDACLAADLVAYDAFWHGAIADRDDGGGLRRSTAALVGDAVRGEPSGWVIDGPGGPPVDALVTIAADTPEMLTEEAAKIEECARERQLTVLTWQDCARLDGGREPFGFKDGVSQPGIRHFTPHEVRNGREEAVEQPGSPIVSAGEFVLGHDPEPGSYPAGRRPVPPAWMHDGSFQVFLRLRQDVEGWKAQMDQLRAEVEEDVEAKAVGRTKDGEPLDPGTSGNDFSYDGDAKGVTTPTFAHIRKMNPRNARFQDGTHRLLRRGVPFSTPVGVPAGDGEDELGLAFNAFMASIEDQFEFLQRHWANRSDLPAAGGPDPVTGASNAPCLLERGNGQQPVELDFGRHVWTTGAVYAFAPSITQLRRLAGLDQAGS